MDRRTYARVREDQFDRVRHLAETKGRDYQAGSADALANFKRHATALGLTSLQVWAVYAGKHWDAIQTYIRDSANLVPETVPEPSEPIMGRLDDLVTYTTLLAGLITEAQIEAGIEAGYTYGGAGPKGYDEEMAEQGRRFATAQVGQRYGGHGHEAGTLMRGYLNTTREAMDGPEDGQ
jgi:hypothetical protein